MSNVTNLYGGKDPRELPAYSIKDAARYLHMSPSTLRAWVRGQKNRFLPVISLSDPRCPELSFLNLIEAHVLNSIRRDYSIPLQKTRKALDVLKTRLHSKRPLASEQFLSDGVDLFVERMGQLHNVSRNNQLAMAGILRTHLDRIEFDHGLAIRLYPFTGNPATNAPKIVVMDPTVAFGRPYVEGAGVPTQVIAERFRAGESTSSLMHDYEMTRDVIEEVIRCENQIAA